MRHVDPAVVGVGVAICVPIAVGIWRASSLRSDVFNNFQPRLDLAQAGLDNNASEALRQLSDRVNGLLGSGLGLEENFNPIQALADPDLSDDRASPNQTRKRRVRFAAIGVAILAVSGLGAGLALASGGSPVQPTVTNDATSGAMFTYYSSVIGSFNDGSMMGNSSFSWMMGRSGYQWMMGGVSAPGWMRGGLLPAYLMGTGTDPGKIMGALFANAPGPRVSASQAAQIGNATPTSATIDQVANRITYVSRTVSLAVLASPTGGPDETFRIAGMVNPTIVVAQGAKVSIEVFNADSDTAHGFVITETGSYSTWMPMMTTRPAFTGSAVWFLGDPTSAGMHEATLTFTASNAGAFRYLCPVPGHAEKGMIGTFVVSRA